MIAHLLPRGVVSVRATEAMADEPLLAGEAERLSRMAPKRRREFIQGRACARRALASLGIEGFALLADEDRAPIWPEGVVGSLTHCRDYCAAAVAPRRSLAGLGIDAEPAEPLEAPLLERIGTSDEHRRWAELPSPGDCGWGHVAFSAKESFYKCWFPATRTFLGFHDAEVDFDPATGHFSVRLLRADVPPGTDVGSFQGRFAVDAQHILTAMWHPADAPRESSGEGVG